MIFTCGVCATLLAVTLVFSGEQETLKELGISPEYNNHSWQIKTEAHLLIWTMINLESRTKSAWMLTSGLGPLSTNIPDPPRRGSANERQ